MSTYRERWGHERTRNVKGHPKREERRQRVGARETREDVAAGRVVRFDDASAAVAWLLEPEP